MGRSWGQCDFEALLKLSEQIAKYSSLDGDQLCRRAAKQLAQILLNKVKKRTPVGVPPNYATEAALQEYWAGYRGGTLRDGWTILPIQKQGDAYTITVINNLEYASYVEFGHRTRGGKGWVNGQYFLTLSEHDLERLTPALIERKLEALLREVFRV